MTTSSDFGNGRQPLGLDLDRKRTTKTSALYEIEEIPNLKFYREADSVTGASFKRPTMQQLRSVYDLDAPNDEPALAEGSKAPSHIVKLGWITGVMVRCILALIGTILFLRLTWVVGCSGIILSAVMIMISGLISVLTTLSLGSVATNGKVKAGGTYFLLSRTLGAEFGGPIGITMSLSDLTASAMIIIGVAETIQKILGNTLDTALKNNAAEFFLSLNGTRVIGLMVLLLMAVIILIGLDFESKIMWLMLSILTLSFVNYLVGLFLTNPEKQDFGFTKFSLETAKTNLWPDYPPNVNFVKVFAVFFPAMTGILAGVNISGNLKNPQRAIPKGTLWAVILATLIYLMIAIFSGLVMCRGFSDGYEGPLGLCADFKCSSSENCTTGLKATDALVYISGWKYLVYAGTFAATLSSASSVLVSGPKIFQAVCRDRILPKFFDFFGKGNAKTDEPHRIYIINFFLSGALICIGSLNAVAHLTTTFVLVGYAFINFACFYASFAKTAGWRPTFRYYNQYVALITALLCIVIMFFVNAGYAIITLLLELLMYMYVRWRRPSTNWGSSSDANNYRIGLRLLRSCTMQGVHAKNFRPQCLILSGMPSEREAMVHFIHQTTKSYSLTICGNIIMDKNITLSQAQATITQARAWLTANKLSDFYTPVIETSLYKGARALLQCCGFGAVRPNILVIGFKKDWKEADPERTQDYFRLIQDTLDMNAGIVIVRFPEEKSTRGIAAVLSVEDEDDDVDGIENGEFDDEIQYPQANGHINAGPTQMIQLSEAIAEGKSGSSQKGQRFIDIWWLFEDGGLTILFPHLLSTRKSWKDAKLRIFIPTVTNTQKHFNSMAVMLDAFRIPYESIQTISDFFDKPSPQLMTEFDEMIDSLRYPTDGRQPMIIKDEELESNRRQTEHYIKLKELLLSHSMEADMVFLTLPVPRQEVSGLFMAWLEFISKDLPPFSFIRGNQENVLTYYT